MSAVIELKQFLREIAKKDYRDGNGSFHIIFMTCHRHDETGGELIELFNACLMGLPPNCKGHEMRGIKDMDTGKKYAVHNRLCFVYNYLNIYWV